MMKSNYGEIDISVTVKTEMLLERLNSNREKHSKEFDEAIEAWRSELAEVLSNVDVKSCSTVPVELETVLENCPESHVSEYDQAIDMFSMCTKDEVLLDTESFSTFCRDEWGWKKYVSKNKYYQRRGLR